jgi:wyosine [tRNA(Phe)-imidazoG37] synthetase (radical SAM superfamily)
MDPHAPSANITTPPSQRKMTFNEFAVATKLTEPQLTKDYEVYEEHYNNYEDGASRVNPNTFVYTRVPTRPRSRTRAQKRTRSRAQKRTRSRAHRLR